MSNRVIVVLLVVIVVVLVAGFFGDDIGRFVEGSRVGPVEKVRAEIAGYCS